MNDHTSRLARIAVLFAGAAPLFMSCASHSAMQVALNDRDTEISMLREERVRLKERIQLLNREKDGLQVALRDASVRVVPPEAADELPAFPELADLGISVGARDGHVVITLPSAITFQSGKADLSQSGRRGLDAVSARLRDGFGGATFHIEGHTDSDPIRKSSFGSNRELSLARSVAVLEYLVAECEIPDERCVVSGHGQYMPLAPNDSKENKAKNRRVEIVVHTPRD